MTLKERYDAIVQTVAEACEAAGRPRDAVRIIGVSKTVDLPAVAEAIEAGIRDFGENRPDELVRKHDAFPDVRWHFIGNIQSRQLDKVVGRACLIHSLYQAHHADKIERLAADLGIVQDVLIEVNDGESNKQGADPADVAGLLSHCAGLPHVNVVGLMTMAPVGDLSVAEQAFERVAALRESLVASGCAAPGLHELSMGMSDDYPAGIAAGATMVRIGRAIFSDDYARD